MIPSAIKIAPSLLAADFANLGDEVARIEDHVEMLHLDVMDGHFVPNISFGMPVINSVRAITRLPLDCHLMTTNPVEYLEDFRKAGADSVSVHIEVLPDPTKAAEKSRELGLGFAVSINPTTPFAAIEPFVEGCSMILVMSVEPGFGGQEFIDDVLPKVEQARSWIEDHGLETDVQIDGGVDPDTVSRCVAAGANVLVAGSAVFGQDDPVEAIRRLRDPTQP